VADDTAISRHGSLVAYAVERYTRSHLAHVAALRRCGIRVGADRNGRGETERAREVYGWGTWIRTRITGVRVASPGPHGER